MAQNNVRLPDWFIPNRYELTLEPDLKRHVFSGSVAILCTLKKSTKTITLHALELAIQSALVSGQAGTPTFDKKSETVTLTFPTMLKKGRHTLTISYTGTLNDKMRGFYRSQYQVAGVEETMAVTQFESTFARFALPCVDEPAAKAEFDVTLVVDHGLTAISNTIETKTEKLPDGRVRLTFKRTPKMSTYLLAFIIGKFGHVEKKTKRGTLTRVFAPKGKEHQAQFALDVAVRCLDFYEDYFGIHYPLPVIDHIAIPDFSAGAMENWGAITYRETALLYDAKESSAQNKQRIALVIAHELAHQWFGNLVTMEWWTDLWLNEGFANFIEYLAIDHVFPEWDIWTQFVDGEANEAMRLDSLVSTHPIEVEVGHPSEINEIFDAVSYAKGATVIRMLEAYLGPAVFRKGLRVYLKKHAYGNARTRDLWAALESVSGKPVKRVMEGWTKHGGYPLLTATRKGGAVTLTQKRYFSAKKIAGTERWAVPITAAYETKRTTFLLEKKTGTLTIPERTAWVNMNVGAVGMYRTHYDSASLMALTAAVRSGTLSAAEKVRLISDVWTLAFSDDSSITDALSFLTAFENENDYSVWSTIVHELLALMTLVEASPAEKLLQEYGVALLTPIANKLDWTQKPNEPHTDALLRGLILSALVSMKDQGTIDECVRRFKAHQNGSRLHPDLRPAVYGAYVLQGGKSAIDTITKLYESEDMHAEKNRLLIALGRAERIPELGRALHYSLGKTVRFQDSRWVFLSAARSVRGAEVAFAVLKKNWNLILDRYGKSGHDLPRYVHCVDVFTTVEQHNDAKKFFKAHKAPGAERAISQALETIASRVQWRKKNLDTVALWLSEWRSSLPR